MHHVAPISFIAPLVGGVYVIEGSANFADAGANHHNWTPAGTGDSRTVMTVEAVFKLFSLATDQHIFAASDGAGNNIERLYIDATGNLHYEIFVSGSTVVHYETTALFRDFSAWYQVVVIRNGNTVTLYVNGTAVAAFDTSDAPTGDNGMFGHTEAHYIGRKPWTTSGYLDLAIARLTYQDGVAASISDYGEAVGNGWKINDVSGLTFGTNGFLIEGGTNMAAGTDSHTTGSATSTFTASSTAYQAGAPTNWAGNFDGISIGTASADRVVVVAISGNNGSTGVPSAVTIAGNSATLAGSTYVGGESDSSIWYATVATGTTADIDITYSSGKQSVSIGVYSITGCNPDPLDTSGSTTADTPSTTITAHPGSTLIACASHAVGSGSTTTWTGPTEDYDEDDAPTSDNCGFTSASADYSALQDEITVTASCDGTAATSSMACAVWEASGTNHFLKTGTITATNDSPTDDATNGYGNRATLNPLSQGGGSVCTGRVFSNGNREYQAPNTATEGDHTRATMTMPFPNDKLTYIEFRVGTNSTTQGAGVCSIDTDHNTTVGFGTNDIGAYDSSTQTRIYKDGVIVGSAFTPRIDTASTDLVCIAYNGSDGKVWIGTSDGTTRTWRDSSGTGRTSDEPGSGTNPTATLDTGIQWFAYAAAYDQGTMDALVDADDWVHTAPSGAVELSTENLPAPAITSWQDHYYAEAGISHTNGSTTAVTLPKSVSGGAMVRIKRTDSTGDWYVVDTVRGANNFLLWNTAAAEDTSTWTDAALSGTTLTLPSALATGTYIIEVFYVSEFFQIKTWTGTTAAQTVAWGTALDSFGAIWNKPRSGIGSGIYFQQGLTTGSVLFTDNSAAQTARANYSQNPDETDFRLEADATAPDLNTNGVTYVAYGWANSGPYKFGAVQLNGSTDGSVVWLGGTPQAYTDKRSDATTSSWVHWIGAKEEGNPKGDDFALESTLAPPVNILSIDMVSTGIKYRDNRGARPLVYSAYGIQPFGGDGVEQARAR